MKKILIIARHEFIATVARKGFVLTLAAMPLFFVAVPGMLIYLMSSQTGAGARKVIGLVDRAGTVDPESIQQSTPRPRAESSQDDSDKSVAFAGYDDLDRALNELRLGRLSAVYVIEPDYVATGNVTSFEREGGLFSSLLSRQANDLDHIMRVSLLKKRVSGDIVERVNKPVVLRENTISRQGEVKPVPAGLEKIAGVLLPVGMFILLSTTILASSSYLLQSTAEERENRVLEVLISSVRPTQLLVGKILGLGGAGLVQVATYLLILVLPAAVFFSASGFGTTKILLSLLYVVLGYLLFASLMAGTGMVSDTVQDSTQYSLIWASFSVLPILLIQPLSSAPNSTMAKVLSFFPLTAPGTMILRTVLSNVPLLDVLISAAGLILGTVLAISGAAKLFRTASLMYGKRLGAREVLRWLREA